MITLELTDVEIDHCTTCGGIWLDSGELELLLDDPEQAGQLLRSFQQSTSPMERSRTCPICDKRMTKIVVGCSAPPLLIDRCPRSDGLWFDKGELEDVVARAQLDHDNRIQHLLADVFSKDRAKHDPEA